MATMKQVAKAANVSIATVSRVINKTGYVSPDLEVRVQEAMDKLAYLPSSLARSLRMQETRTIGVLIPQLNQPFFSTLAFAIEKSLFAQDYRALICSAEEDGDKERSYVDMFLRQRVDGVVVVPTGHSSQTLLPLMNNGTPMVMVDRYLKGFTVNQVFSDNVSGAYQGMRHLLELGHRRISVIGTSHYSEPMNDRLKGIDRALAEHGGDIVIEHFMSDTLQHFEMGYDTAKQVLTRDSRPTAIFALMDVIAIGIMHAAAELHMSIPHDLSVIGFDDIPLSSFSIPTLTTVAQPIYEMGEVAAGLLLKSFSDDVVTVETITLDTQLMIRQSTASPQT
ncbi:MAG: LacI family DNA-binding transcriptional regulator [Aggregatilineales bacterium]